MNATIRNFPSDEEFISSVEMIPLALEPSAGGVCADEPEQDQALALARFLPPSEHWRLFPEMRERARYIDIETLGLAPEDPITALGISDGRSSTVLVRGQDMTRERVGRLLQGAGLFVTFNGINFDVPRLRRAFPGLPWNLPHFDLAIEGRRLGLKGGLKKVERRLGYTRPRDLRGVDGPGAIRLWREHCQGNPRALRRLVRYCHADVEALVHLAERIYGRLARRYADPEAGWIDLAGR